MVKRILRGLAWRTVWRHRILVFRAPPLEETPRGPDRFRLLHLRAGNSDLMTAEAAMLAGGEPAGLTAERFRRGDEFFGWQEQSQVAAFGWVTFGARIIGRSPVPAARNRAFLYNFHTLAEFRGRGLYPQLLLAVRHALTARAKDDVIIDVNARNQPSLAGVKKAGFRLVGETSYVTVLGRWNCATALITLTDIPPIATT